MNCDNLIGEEIAVTSEIKRPDFVNRFRMCAVALLYKKMKFINLYGSHELTSCLLNNIQLLRTPTKRTEAVKKEQPVRETASQ